MALLPRRDGCDVAKDGQASRVALLAALICLPVVLMAGCQSDGPRNVLASGPFGISESGPAHVDEIIDQSVTLHNVSGHPVRLRSIRIVGLPEAHLLNVRAYSIRKLGYGGLSQTGDLPSECPGWFVPRPIGSFAIAPHRDSDWMVVIAFRISRPGTYHLRRLRISYSTDGGRGWQYEYPTITYTISNPPLPGLRPLPKSAVCGKP
jgi:hypothetical protein